MTELAPDDTIQQFFAGQLASEQADDLLVISTTSAMALTLKEEREAHGRSGWHTEQMTNDWFYRRLEANLYEPRSMKSLTDIIILAAMLRVRLEVYGSHGAIRGPADIYPTNGLNCSVCGHPQRITQSGVVCENGHGGVEGVLP